MCQESQQLLVQQQKRQPAPGKNAPPINTLYLLRGRFWPTCNKINVKYTNNIKILLFLNTSNSKWCKKKSGVCFDLKVGSYNVHSLNN